MPAPRRLRELVLMPLLLGYLALLALGALVEPIRPDFLTGAHVAANAVLHRVPVYAGMDVFKGVDQIDSFHKAACVVVVGHGRGGEKRILYSRMEDCDGPGFRLYADTFNIFLLRTIDATVRAMQQGDAKGEAVHLGAVSSYFCRSPLVDNAGIEAVSIVHLQLKQSYATGAITSKSFLMSHWSCALGRALPAPWPGLRDVLPEPGDG